VRVRETRRSYDAVAERYTSEIRSELDHKPLDRALLDALAELAGGEGPVADIGAGPGHVADYLAHRGCQPFAVDFSLAMCAVARGVYALPTVGGDMTAVPLRPASVAGVVCLYAVIHLDRVERAMAYSEFARILRADGYLLLAFHVCDHETATGKKRTLREWWDHDVDLVFRFLDPAEEIGTLEEVGLEFVARMDREPYAGVEHASRRTYLLFRRPAPPP
jgi:SAM-dependent methyltransferase